MESRYALRELECVIGRDRKHLPDGRQARFPHTRVGDAMVYAFLERRDSMMVISSIMMSRSSAMGNDSLNYSAVMERFKSLSESLKTVTFPYVGKTDEKDSGKSGKEALYEEMFKKLREIKKSAAKKAEGAEKDQPSGDGVEADSNKMV